MISLYWVALKTIWIKEVTRFGRIRSDNDGSDHELILKCMFFIFWV